MADSDEEDDGKTYSHYESMSFQVDLSRFFGLVIFLLFVLKISLQFNSKKLSGNNLCIPGEFRSVEQLVHKRIALFHQNAGRIDIPIYSTHDMNLPTLPVTSVVLIQHGNLRNANDYFCGAKKFFGLCKLNIC